MTTKHLWETDHPYYMTEGNYYANDCHDKYVTWAAFLSAWGDADKDYNWVVRWDWLEGADWNAGEFTGDAYYRNGRFLVQIILQRKAILRSCEVAVCRADEPAVLEYLNDYWTYMQTMWAPLSEGGAA